MTGNIKCIVSPKNLASSKIDQKVVHVVAVSYTRTNLTSCQQVVFPILKVCSKLINIILSSCYKAVTDNLSTSC